MAEPIANSVPHRVQEVLHRASRLGDVLPGVVAVGLAGSWARGAGRADSDIDIVVLTTHPAAALESTAWFSAFGSEVSLVRCADFGAIQERRLTLADDTVVEIGFGRPAWASTDPVDAGTRKVVQDGLVILHDPFGLLRAIAEAIESGSV